MRRWRVREALDRVGLAHDARRRAAQHAREGDFRMAGLAYKLALSWYDLAHTLAFEAVP